MFTEQSVGIVIPVFNEAETLRASVETLESVLDETVETWFICLAVNGSSDGSDTVAQALSDQRRRVKTVIIEEAGKGRAVREGMDALQTDIVGFIDADLSPSAENIADLIPYATSKHSMCIGSRHLPESDVTWSWRRTTISRWGNKAFRLLAWTDICDHQCGLKLMHTSTWESLGDMMRSDHWFFDTEIILHAKRVDVDVTEIPITWADHGSSHLKMVAFAWDVIQGFATYYVRHGLPHFQR